jgi:hypothetical protein
VSIILDELLTFSMVHLNGDDNNKSDTSLTDQSGELNVKHLQLCLVYISIISSISCYFCY